MAAAAAAEAEDDDEEVADEEEAAADLLELLLPLPWGLGDGDGEFGDSVGERLTGADMAAIEKRGPPEAAATRRGDEPQVLYEEGRYSKHPRKREPKAMARANPRPLSTR